MDSRAITLAALGAFITTAGASAQVYNDGRGNEWLQLPATVNVSWDQIAAACPIGGAAPCTGTLNGRDLSGWTWATREQVRQLFATVEPRILEGPTLSGPEYLLSALTFLGGGSLSPTFSYYTTFGGYLYAAGWLSELNHDGTGAIAAISAQYPSSTPSGPSRAPTTPPPDSSSPAPGSGALSPSTARPTSTATAPSTHRTSSTSSTSSSPITPTQTSTPTIP